MKKILVLLATSTVLGACSENKVQPITDGGVRLTEPAPIWFYCPKKQEFSTAVDATVEAVDAANVAATADASSANDINSDLILLKHGRLGIDMNDRVAKAGILQYVTDRLTEEKAFHRYLGAWASGADRPKLKPFDMGEAKREIAVVRAEAAIQARDIVAKLEATQVKWTDIYDMLKRVVEAKYENGNPVAPGSIEGKILYMLVWCNGSML